MIDDILPAVAPELNLPPGNVCCNVSIINTTTDITCSTHSLLEPRTKGFELLNLPTYAFHIKNQKTGTEIMFDLGSRKDWWNTPPLVANAITNTVPGVRVKYGIHDILTAGGVKLENIKAIVLSHFHWDHIGDVSKFGPQTDLVVGPGFKKEFLPGYPLKKDSLVLQSDVEGRHIDEIDFSQSFKIGQFQAFDYFKDGSVYILNAPGHAVGHICCLVRDTPSTFVFLGGDITHFGGAFRPSPYIPLPSTIPKSTILDPGFSLPCPCSVFIASHPVISGAAPDVIDTKLTTAARTTPFYTPASSKGSWYLDSAVAGESINKLQEHDANQNVLVILAHDPDSAKYFDFFPNGTLNNWKESRSANEGHHWSWLNELPRGTRSGRGALVEGRIGKPQDSD